MALKYIGTICGTYGLKGAVHICDFISSKLSIKPEIEINIGYSEKYSEKYILEKLNRTKKGAIALLRGINSDTEASKLIEKGIFVDEKYIIESNQEAFLIDEIIGCNVIDINSNRELGKITDVWVLPANDVWVMTSNDKEIPIPVIDEVIASLDLKQKRIFINVIEGLLDI